MLSNYYQGLPNNYFTSLQSPLMRLDIPHGRKVSFENNVLKSLNMIQPMWNDLHYDASIILLESTTP